jgi:NAD(P)-dependent dehydrogenase (short-subunit alcohol dehydrogenase family)
MPCCRNGGAWEGVVINIVGMGGKVATPSTFQAAAANSALMLATVGLANVYGPKGIRVNAINPGATMTDRVKEALSWRPKRAAYRRGSAGTGQAKVPLRRFAHSEDVANLTLFLASDQASYVTGAVVAMDGGLNPVL